MKRYTRLIRQHMVGVSTGIAKKYGVTYGIVLSRNPDGSLNVDDGQGGCARVMAAQNVRVGDQIPIGTEPSIGQTTSLSPTGLTIPPSSLSCPTDPRLVPPQFPISAALTTLGSGDIENGFTPPWAGRPGNMAFATVTPGFDAQVIGLGSGWGLTRGFGEFALSLPAGAVIVSASLTIHPQTVHSDADRDVCVVGAFVPGYPLMKTYMNDLDLDHRHVLGRVRILDTTVGVAHTIPLDPTSSYLLVSPIQLALVVDWDLDNGGTPSFLTPGHNDHLMTSFGGTPPALNITYEFPITVDTEE